MFLAVLTQAALGDFVKALNLKMKHMHSAPHGLFHHTPTVNTSAQSDAVDASLFIAHAKFSTLVDA